VIVVNGPRQSGKSWLLRRLATESGRYVSLDVPAELRAARLDPSGFVGSSGDTGPFPLLIDEVQRAGDPLVLAIKVAADAASEPGRFVLAGSTRFLTEPRLSESLAGRARLVDLWPLAQCEIEGVDPPNLCDLMLGSFSDLAAFADAVPPSNRASSFVRVVRGGYPEAVPLESPVDRAEFFADYVRTIAQRDIREISRLGQRIELPDVLRLLAARTATELNHTSLANDAGLGADTMRRYVPLVETIFLAMRLPAFGTNLASRVVRRPKMHLVDSGLAAHLIGVRDHAPFARPGHDAAGPLLETFVANEVVRLAGWSVEQPAVKHWRDEQKREVDIVLEAPDGRIAGIEVKAAADLDDGDVRHLAYLRDRLGDRFVSGVVLHCGDRGRRLGDRLVSMPVSALWS
jgi:uncharacterized protein